MMPGDPDWELVLARHACDICGKPPQPDDLWKVEHLGRRVQQGHKDCIEAHSLLEGVK